MPPESGPADGGRSPGNEGGSEKPRLGQAQRLTAKREPGSRSGERLLWMKAAKRQPRGFSASRYRPQKQEGRSSRRLRAGAGEGEGEAEWVTHCGDTTAGCSLQLLGQAAFPG
ncbi:hypothetical protein NN561_008783 [Cricetulus griseus]